MDTPRPSLLDLHPVEALLALLLISAAALLRLVANPPRPICIRRRLPVVPTIRQPQSSAAPAVGIAPGLTVAELRTMARQQGLAQVGGRPIHKARKADLLTTLELCNG